MPDIDHSTRSPYARQANLKAKIEERLAQGATSADILAAYVGHGIYSVRVRLSQLKHEGRVDHSPEIPYVWRLKQAAA